MKDSAEVHSAQAPCVRCLGPVISKTRRARRFCSRACTSSFWIRTPEYKEKARARFKELRQEAIAKYGGACSCCGESNYEFLAFDHINGGGTKFRKNSTHSRIEIYLRKNNYPEGIRLLCHNCNSALGFYGYCPHEKL